MKKELFFMKKCLQFLLLTFLNSPFANAQFESNTPNEKLKYAITQGSIQQIKDAIKNGADINAKYERGETPLIIAVSGPLGDNPSPSEIVKLLLDKGADANAKDKSGRTALFIICLNESNFLKEAERLKIAQLLIDKGADKEVIPNADSGPSGTPLMYAAMNGNVELIKLLISKGANVNAKNESGDTPLILLVKADATFVSDYTKAKIIQLLLNKKANPYQKNEMGENAISIVKENGQTEILKALTGQAVNIQEPKQNNGNDDGTQYTKSLNSQFFESIMDGDMEAVKEKLKNGADINFVSLESSPLSLACTHAKKNNYELVELLLSNGANPNLRLTVSDNSSALFVATEAATKSYFLYKTGKKNDIIDMQKNGEIREDGYETFMKIMELLLKKGAKPDGILNDGMGYTPLMVAAQYACLPAVKLLLKYGASVKINVSKGVEIMSYAACGNMGGEKVLSNQMENIRKEWGETEKDKKVDADIKMMVQRDEERLKKEFPERWEEIQKRKKEDAEEEKNNPQKLQNVIAEYTEIVRLLIANGANVNVNVNWITPLMQAKAMNATEMINLLKKAGAR